MHFKLNNERVYTLIQCADILGTTRSAIQSVVNRHRAVLAPHMVMLSGRELRKLTVIPGDTCNASRTNEAYDQLKKTNKMRLFTEGGLALLKRLRKNKTALAPAPVHAVPAPLQPAPTINHADLASMAAALSEQLLERVLMPMIDRMHQNTLEVIQAIHQPQQQAQLAAHPSAHQPAQLPPAQPAKTPINRPEFPAGYLSVKRLSFISGLTTGKVWDVINAFHIRPVSVSSQSPGGHHIRVPGAEYAPFFAAVEKIMSTARLLAGGRYRHPDLGDFALKKKPSDVIAEIAAIRSRGGFN